MSDILCSYHDREAMLMAYLYDEIAPSDRQAFDAHLTTCARCRVELNGLGGVRARLAGWAPPDYLTSPQSVVGSPAVGSPAVDSRAVGSPAVGSQAVGSPAVGGQVVGSQAVGSQAVGSPAVGSPAVGSPAGGSRQSAGHGRGWRDVPAWAQAAAAVLVLGASAGMANLNVHYDGQNGLNIRTGWSRPQEPAPAAAVQTADVVNRSDLTALEQQLRHEIQTSTGAPAQPRPVTIADLDARRIKTLLDESERRHEREMALRIAEVVREVNAQRQSDLVKIDQNLGLIDRRNDIEVRKNRQMIDMYLQRVSQRQ